MSWKEYSQSKLVAPEALAAKVSDLRRQGKTIATLNGSFDLLHAGHMYMIYEASKVADVLLVAVNSDASVKAYKSPKRPIVPLQYRLEMLSAIGFIDYLTWFDETDPRKILTVIKPDVHVNGIEYGEDCIEAALVKQQGGRLHLVDRIPGLATSEIIHTIQGLS
ncbi:adenylyltransferase/cytidyltransferase family protein [Chlamydiota bacterium]